eukprot:5780746-Prymnesium_polylepis.1
MIRTLTYKSVRMRKTTLVDTRPRCTARRPGQASSAGQSAQLELAHTGSARSGTERSSAQRTAAIAA